jgi:3-isopropylmalate dehydrogenase
MNKKIAVIPGDGIGPEVTAQSIKVLNAIGQRFGHVFSYEYALMGADAIDKTGSPLPDETVTTCLVIQNMTMILLLRLGLSKGF